MKKFEYLKNDSNVGVIKSIIDGVVVIEGLSNVKANVVTVIGVHDVINYNLN